MIAIDFPGHGHSSHLPAGLHYHELESVGYVQRVAAHFDWKSFSFLGHSMGGDMGELNISS